MTNDITYQSNPSQLIVFRGPADSIVRDHFEGSSIQAKVQDNGSLHVSDSGRTIAAYPAGAWKRVTPTPRDQ